MAATQSKIDFLADCVSELVKRADSIEAEAKADASADRKEFGTLVVSRREFEQRCRDGIWDVISEINSFGRAEVKDLRSGKSKTVTVKDSEEAKADGVKDDLAGLGSEEKSILKKMDREGKRSYDLFDDFNGSARPLDRLSQRGLIAGGHKNGWSLTISGVKAARSL